MKRAFALVAVVIAALCFAASAFAWHANNVVASATCDASNGVYNVSATITQNSSYPGAFVKSISPSTFSGSTSGSQHVTVVLGWPNSTDTQVWNLTVNLDGKCTKPVTVIPSCPDGYTSDGLQNGVLLCTRTVTNTVTQTVTNTVTVYGTPICPSGDTMLAQGQGYVVCQPPISQNIVKVPVKVTQVKVVYKTKTKIVYRIKYRIKTKVVTKLVVVNKTPKKAPFTK